MIVIKTVTVAIYVYFPWKLQYTNKYTCMYLPPKLLNIYRMDIRIVISEFR